MREEEREFCIVCEERIHRSHRTKIPNRSPRSVTCSNRCARIYYRVHRYLYGRIQRSLMKKLGIIEIKRRPK